jgi:hypothetical protein
LYVLLIPFNRLSGLNNNFLHNNIIMYKQQRKMGCSQHLQWVLLLLIISFNNILQIIHAQNEDYYCGLDFMEVGDNCALPCPSGEDSECTAVLGDYGAYGCYYFTGCADKIAGGFVPVSPIGDSEPVDVVTSAPVVSDAPVVSTVVTEAPTQKATAAPTDAVLTPAPIEIETSAPTAAAIEITTNKPTRRTRNPTKPPQTVVSTPKPSSPPVVFSTSSSTPTLGTIESIQTADANDSTSTTSTSYGFIFSLRTTSKAPVMEVVGIDFMTASTSQLRFELYAKMGSYLGSEVSVMVYSLDSRRVSTTKNLTDQ